MKIYSNTVNRVYRAICVTLKPDTDIWSAGSLDTIGVLTRGSIHLTAGIDLVSSETAKSILQGLQLLLLWHLWVPCHICQPHAADWRRPKTFLRGVSLSNWTELHHLNVWTAKEVNSCQDLKNAVKMSQLTVKEGSSHKINYHNRHRCKRGRH